MNERTVDTDESTVLEAISPCQRVVESGGKWESSAAQES
jgi:hypothetical protein